MKTYIVDSFTTEAFKGNPAGVSFPQQALSEERMQHIAMELGLSETAFVQSAGTPGSYAIRYFSPKKEIPLCGHATLAAAKVIFGNTDAAELHFITIQNLDLKIQRKGQEISMEFPVYNTVPATIPGGMMAALGLNEVLNAVYNEQHNIIMLEISNAEILRNLQPNFAALLQTHHTINGVLVTAASQNAAHDYHYRYFCPWAGTNEDPVTGGVQTFLAKYWADKLGKTSMKAFQASARTGYMQVEITGNKVILTSQAIVVLEGQLQID